MFLTNALTGWEPPDPARAPLLFPELAAERAAAEAVKQEASILVILGNPPYNGFAGLAVDEERELADAYRGPARPGLPVPQGQGLNDLYVRFFRMAERRIAGGPPGRGIVSFISNYSWLDGLSHPLMRARFAEAFDAVWVDCLNGDKYKTGKLTPDGRPDPSAFSTESNREGIQVGTAVVTMVRGSFEVRELAPALSASAGEGNEQSGSKLPHSKAAIRFRHFWGKDKRAELEASGKAFDPAAYQTLAPPAALGLPFVPVSVGADWLTWPRLPELLPANYPGVKTSRDDYLVAIDRPDLEKRIADYFTPEFSDEEIARRYPGLMESTVRYDASAVRRDLLERGPLAGSMVRYCYRPFDVRWLFWVNDHSLLDRPRPDYRGQAFAGNLWLEARQRQTKEDFNRGYVTTVLADTFGNGCSNFFPLLFSDAPILNGYADPPRPNLSPAALAYLAGLGADVPADSLFFHAVATLHAPAYRAENAGALRQDWPRVPLPENKAALLASADLGRRVAALLDPETTVPGVTAGNVEPAWQRVARLSKLHELLNPATDLAVTAGWGHFGQGGAVMPGRGRLVSGFESESLSGVQPGQTIPPDSFDVYLNATVFWDNVPAAVWNYTLGGYPVLKKWLSYRESSVLGRALRPEEAREFTAIARRIAALLALGPDLDAAYRAASAVV